MGFSDSSLFLKIALGLGILAFLFDIIGLGSPYWLTYGDIHSFLFKGCAGSVCSDVKNAPSEIEATQAMVIIGFLAGAGAIGLLVVYILVLNNKMIRLGSMVAAFVAAGFTLIGVIIIGDYNNGGSDIGWAMVFCILGALLYIAVGALVVLDVVKS